MQMHIFFSIPILGKQTAHPFRLVSTEEACVVAFLHHDIGDAWLIVFLQLNARISDGQELVVENLQTRLFIRI